MKLYNFSLPSTNYGNFDTSHDLIDETLINSAIADMRYQILGKYERLVSIPCMDLPNSLYYILNILCDNLCDLHSSVLMDHRTGAFHLPDVLPGVDTFRPMCVDLLQSI